jgi:hypothetical protein
MDISDTSPTARPSRQVLQAAFLQYLREGYPVSRAAALAGVHRDTVYGWRERSPKFRRVWESAYAEGSDAVEEEARRRAVDGWDEATAWGVVHRYSDALLAVLLRGRKRDLYGTYVRVTPMEPPTEIVIRYVNERGDAISRNGAHAPGNVKP